MKKLLLAVLGALSLAIGGYAIAQVTLPAPVSMGVNDRIQVIPNGAVGPTNVYATLTQMRAWLLGGVSGHSGIPALTNCGGGTPTIVGTDLAFTVTQGTTATGCVATFSTAFAMVPVCVACAKWGEDAGTRCDPKVRRGVFRHGSYRQCQMLGGFMSCRETVDRAVRHFWRWIQRDQRGRRSVWGCVVR